ncbi:pantoate--beta-alanine ligase [Luminiphilus syltensis NOR5-1B]|uniref:Pantothenate synthetase n=1 Tax=Luminiphilus syltensis NOR5-1B TaxID=565045 RepID=B8KRY8_9GAMM|nr:pantoate--beta-alanine ligase [Luminiphilus syltensis]EED34104.1 pantoate--beta-alanine ligase [Luminiphilus syltensis NOR5-1B]
MEIVSDSNALRSSLAQCADNTKTVAFVPTMGNLHAGHLALVDRARHVADCVAVSIFVNPMQFGQNEDLDSYPRSLQKDIEQLERLDTDLVFTPTTSDIYPEGIDRHTQVKAPGLTNVLCGASRPGHFDGVTTVCCKLFNLVRPDVAIFGEKDLQQVMVIRKMVSDLALPLNIETVATARAEDGLALSSRNGRLTPEERAKAPSIYQALVDCAQAIRGGDRDFQRLQKTTIEHLDNVGFATDYFEIRRRDNLELATPEDTELAIFAAARLGSTRLIDNISV